MDISKYKQRLKLDMDLKNDFETLKTLHKAQAFNIAFENFNVTLKQDIPLDKDSLFKKLVLENRGGYCYELNSLFSFVLQKLGFEVTHLIGRPLYGYNNALRPKTHMVLKVHTQGKDYLCDLGFGGRGLIEPIELIYHQEHEQYGDVFKLIEHTEGYALQAKLSDNWISLYSFDLRPQELIDYELANFFNMHSSDSRFTQQVICAKPTPEGRILLLDKEFKYQEEGKSKTVKINTNENYNKILDKYFSITTISAQALFCE